MNKRQKKKQFKKLYGMNPKQYQQAMQLTSLEEPLKKNYGFGNNYTYRFGELSWENQRRTAKISFCFRKVEL